MSHFQFIPYNWTDGTRLRPLPFTQFRFSLGMNRGQAGSASLPLKDLDDDNLLWLNGSEPRRHLVVVEREGAPLWVGAVMRRRYRSKPKMLDLAFTDLWGWAASANRSPTKSYSGSDYYDLIRDQIGVINPLVNNMIVVDPASATLGLTTSFDVGWWERRPIPDVVGQISEKDDGPDFRLDYAWSGNDLVPTFRMGAPLGRVAAVSNLVVDAQRLTEFRVTESVGDAADTVDVLGAGTGATTARGTASDTRWSSTYLPLSAVINRRHLQTDAECQAVAETELCQRSAAPSFMEIVAQVPDGENPGLGAWVPGDGVTFRSAPGEEPRYPDGVSKAMRILAADVTVDRAGTETTDLLLVNPAARNTFSASTLNNFIGSMDERLARIERV